MLKKAIALPQDHGSWVFLLSPLFIGLFIGRTITLASIVFIAAALAAFLLRQPVSIAVKAWSGRRSRSDFRPALFWILIYGGVLFLFTAWLIRLGHARLLWLGIPAALVFGWYLWLVRKRSERRQIGMEIVATGALALAAPAAFWVGRNAYHSLGWLLWVLCWLQSATSIVYAYLRLEQRGWTFVPTGWIGRFRPALRALLYATFGLLLAVILGIAGIIPPFIWTAYALQWCECIYGSLRPAVKARPAQIGIRQLVVSTLFTLLFILLWR
ncbi:MAG: YwiC-like family protein [Anaerolineales bacterium]|nr:YwiC-like family protein [Anaerolineales bacterium]MDW8447924.1 YwiC-like family protein [Anaerolineales bacterium]